VTPDESLRDIIAEFVMVHARTCLTEGRVAPRAYAKQTADAILAQCKVSLLDAYRAGFIKGRRDIIKAAWGVPLPSAFDPPGDKT
jgi:hypothetical protein